MTTELFIDDARITEKINLQAFALERTRSQRFRGFLYDHASGVQTPSAILLRQPDIVRHLLSLRDKRLTNARSEFRATIQSRQLFVVDVDFSTVRHRRDNRIEFSFHDRDASAFIQNADQDFDLSPNRTIEIATTEAGTLYPLIVDKDLLTVRRQTRLVRRENFSPAFDPGTSSPFSGTLTAAPSTDPSAFYVNTNAAPAVLRLSAALSGVINASHALIVRAKVYVRDAAGSVLHELHLSDSTVAANVDTPFAALNDLTVPVPANCSVSIVFEPDKDTTRLFATFAEGTKIVLSETDAAQTIQMPVLSVYDALKALVALASDNLLTLDAPWIHDECAHLHLTSSRLVKGFGQPFRLSFGSLFDDLNALLCLKCDKVGNKIFIRPLADAFRHALPYRLKNLADYTVETHFSALYRSVAVGFEDYAPENSAGLPELTAPLELITSLTTAPNELNLRCRTLCASPRVIAETHRDRDRPDVKNREADKDRILIVSTRPGYAFTPDKALDAHAPLLHPLHGPLLTKSTGTGAYADAPYSYDLSDAIAHFQPQYASVQCTMPTEDFYAIGDFVEVSDLARTFVVYVEFVSHTPHATTAYNTLIEGPLLNPAAL